MDCGTKNLVLITGDETFLKEEKRDELLLRLNARGSMNFNAFDGENIDLSEIRRLCGTMPFFEEKRKILISESGLFKANSPSGKEAAEIFSDIPETTVVIFMETEAAASSPLYKLVKKGGCIYKYESTELKRGRDKTESMHEVSSWLQERIRKENRKISTRAADALADMAGYDMLLLTQETEKLLSFVLDKPGGYVITMEDISSICSMTLKDRVFNMVDYKLKGHVAEAVSILEELFALRVPAMKTLRLLQKQYEQALIVRDCMDRRMDDAEIMSKLDIKRWQLSQIKGRAAGLSAGNLRNRLEESVEAEYRIKTGDLQERLALELLITG